MGALSIIWIIVFLFLGFRLTFQTFDIIDFGVWDNLFGIALILVALFGVYCMIKDTSAFVKRMKSRLGPEKIKLAARINSGLGLDRLKASESESSAVTAEPPLKKPAPPAAEPEPEAPEEAAEPESPEEAPEESQEDGLEEILKATGGRMLDGGAVNTVGDGDLQELLK